MTLPLVLELAAVTNDKTLAALASRTGYSRITRAILLVAHVLYYLTRVAGAVALDALVLLWEWPRLVVALGERAWAIRPMAW